MKNSDPSSNVFQRLTLKYHKLLIRSTYECLHFRHMLITTSALWFGCAIVLGSAAPLMADYSIILKNGRTVTVEAYKVDGEMIIFSSYGGEIRIAKEDVQSIIPAVEGVANRQVSPQTEVVPGEPPGLGPGEKKLARPGQVQGMEGMKDEPLATKEKDLTPEEIKAEERAKKEKEYQKRFQKVTAQIRALRDRFALANRRSPGPEPSLLESPEAIRARTADLNSRLRDAQHNPAGPSDRGDVRLATPSPFTGAPPRTINLRPGGAVRRVNPPPPPYSAKEKKLSVLRKQILESEKERDRLIQEMREKDFKVNAASLTP